jgi:[acyl-carrier-protein] S-malonyltransferase
MFIKLTLNKSYKHIIRGVGKMTMKIGFLFPGQGAQVPGMGKDLYDKYDCVRNVYDKVLKTTGIDVAGISFSDNDDRLNETKYTQLCILTMSLGILEILKQNMIKAEISAGLSLGEYTALIYSGLFGFDDGIKIVEKRGKYMSELVPEGNWKMAAILGLSDEQVEEVCKKVTSGFVVPVNYNCIGQVAISGEEVAIQEAETIAKEYGAKKVVVLNTSGPFHTEKLKNSANALEKDLNNISFNKMNSKVVKNLNGEFYNNDDDFVKILVNHMINPVRFSKSINTMIENGIDTFIEIGPGRTLSGFVKRMKSDKDINILNINDLESLDKTINFVKEKENE